MTAPLMVPKMDGSAADFASGLRAQLERWHPDGSDTGKQARRLAGRWRRRLCSDDGPKNPIARFVGVMLSAGMLSNNGATPTQKQLAVQTGLTTMGIHNALNRLVTEHWLIRISDKQPGRAGHRYVLNTPRIPAPARRKGKPDLPIEHGDQTPKLPSFDVERPVSTLKVPQNNTVRNAVIGGAPC